MHAAIARSSRVRPERAEASRRIASGRIKRPHWGAAAVPELGQASEVLLAISRVRSRSGSRPPLLAHRVAPKRGTDVSGPREPRPP